MMETIEQATDRESELRARLEVARAALERNKARRKELAYDAETGDAVAKREVAALIKSAAAAEAELESLVAASAEAARRVVAAKAAKQDAKERLDAEKALQILDDFARRGAALDAKLDAALDEMVALWNEARALDAVGYPPNTLRAVQMNMSGALVSKVQTKLNLGLRWDVDWRFRSPAERARGFAMTIEGWAQMIRNRATARLGRSAKAA